MTIRDQDPAVAAPLDAGQFRLADMADVRWRGDVSPHFEGALRRIEEAIDRLPGGEADAPVPWPPLPLLPPTAPRLTPSSIAPGGDLSEAGVAALARAIADGSVRSADVVEVLLSRATNLQPNLHVWAYLDADGARRRARDADRARAEGNALGPLHGVPLGIKDIFHAGGMPTAANSAVMPAPATVEAAAVSRLRVEGGAVLLGKTATTEYAYADPSEARNPWNPAHTPGGSSSGSAAGVAARMMPGALGTQTAGSVLRPAAYCSVVGFKPTTERISRAGVLPLARSLDHVGTLTRNVADAAVLYRVMTRAAEVEAEARSPRLALWPDLLDGHTDAETRDALRAAGATLERAGARVTPVESKDGFSHSRGLWELMLAAHAVIMAAEVASYHLHAHAGRVKDLGPRLRAMVEAGALVPAQALLAAQQARYQTWHQWHEVSKARHFDAVIVPAAPGTAPEGLASTGDPSLNGPWSLIGVPAITIPIAVAANGLPLGMQLVAPYGEDARLLSVASWCEQAIGFEAGPRV
jgi:Asp-tRNA(Asn)/Glu-tRNA(Gln) amidotransferase A subunit family amidase